MADEIVKNNESVEAPAEPVPSPAPAIEANVEAAPAFSKSDKPSAGGFMSKFNRPFRKNVRKGGGKPERVKPEFDQKIIQIRRVARVAAGGRRFNFSVAMVAGNRKGSVGVGLGKAGDTALAIDKAMRSAKKNMINVELTKTGSIPYESATKYSSASVVIRPAPGRGLVAGSALRHVLELCGIKDVTAKILSGSKNQLNVARATVETLREFTKGRSIKKKAPSVKALEK